jgi:hypothetical protein
VGRGMQVSDWLKYVHSQLDLFPQKLKEIYNSFTAETVSELSQSRDELERKIKTDPGLVQKYISGEAGNNVLFNTQARIYLEVMKELHEVAFEAVHVFSGLDRAGQNSIEMTYLNDLQRYSVAKKQQFVNLQETSKGHFEFDFIALERENFTRVPTQKKPTDIAFYYEQWQKDFFADQMEKHGTSPQGLGKLLSRIPIKKTQRATRYADSVVLENVSSQTPLSESSVSGPVII